MSKVRIVQVLCPSRHCIVASAYESPDGEPICEVTDSLRARVESMLATNAMDPWCGICKSRSWSYDDQATAYSTMEEALPQLQKAADQQAITRAYFRASRG